MPMKEMCAMFTCPVASCRRRLMVRSRFMATVVATSRWYESCVSQGSATPMAARSASVTRGRTAMLRATDQSARPQHQDGDDHQESEHVDGGAREEQRAHALDRPEDEAAQHGAGQAAHAAHDDDD